MLLMTFGGRVVVFFLNIKKISSISKNRTLGLTVCFKWEKYIFFQEEVTAEESTDGEVEAQAYNQDSQDSIGEVSVFEKKKMSLQ